MVDRLASTLNKPLSPGLTTGDDLGLNPNQRRKPVTAMLQGGVSAQQQPAGLPEDRFVAAPDNRPVGASRPRVAPPASVNPARSSTGATRIGLNAILDDFNNTTQALGADGQTQGEVNAYLSVVRLQGQASAPNVSLIQQSLSSAALTLDRFIAKALQSADSSGASSPTNANASTDKPAPVVQEWVDALLAQDIDYRFKPATSAPAGLSTSTAAEVAENSLANGPAQSAPSRPQPPNTQPLKLSMVEVVQKTRELAQSGDLPNALSQLDNGLQQLDEAESGGELFRPDLRGKLAMMKATLQTRTGEPVESVLASYQQAATAFSEAGLPQKEAQALHAMAGRVALHAQTTGQPDLMTTADTLFSEATQLHRAVGQPQSLIQSLNDWAALRVNQGDAQGAIPLLTEAVKVSGQAQDPATSADLWHNLAQAQAQVGNRGQAMTAFQNSLQQRFNASDKPGYAATLNAMAQWAEQSGRPGAATELRNRAQRLLF